MTLSRLLASLALALWLVPVASAQQPPPGPYGNPPPGPPGQMPPVAQPGQGLQSSAGLTNALYAAAQFTQPQQQYAPGGGYSPYGVPYIESPAAGYLSGVADVTTANGQYMVQTQQARLLQSQADMSKLDLRRKIADQQRYLKSLEPTPEELRQKDIMDAINRARNNPPPAEIWSGKSLNALLTAIQREQRGNSLGPVVPLSPDVLRHINLTNGTTSAGAGMLKDLRRIAWPLPLLDDSLKDARMRTENLARQAAEQAASGPIDPVLIRDFQKSINDMISATKAKVDDLTPTQYVQCMRFLREMNDSTKALQDPNVGSYFSERYRAAGNSVADLVRSMTDRGLTFAPAVSGDEPYYTALQGAMVSYDYGLRQLASR
jgi:hypothetical protein